VIAVLLLGVVHWVVFTLGCGNGYGAEDSLFVSCGGIYIGTQLDQYKSKPRTFWVRGLLENLRCEQEFREGREQQDGGDNSECGKLRVGFDELVQGFQGLVHFVSVSLGSYWAFLVTQS
jgi:hypothetical protein